MEQFYIYIYRDPSRNNEPIYVGKGKGTRASRHLKRTDKHPFTHRLQKMKREGVEPHIEIINAIDEDHALFMEKCVVDVVGRKDLGKGPLLNLVDGGRAGPRNLSPEARAKLSKANGGRVFSAEARAKMGAAASRKSAEYRKSAAWTSERLAAHRTTMADLWTPERKDSYRTMTELLVEPKIVNAKISAARLGKTLSAESKAKISAARLGKPKPRVTCPHCGKEGGASGPMMWHHFDNCKYAP